tara:strand:+ start:64583 stop:64999 length:417 start_codon:yes stop_codon:yes gene_type:complete
MKRFKIIYILFAFIVFSCEKDKSNEQLSVDLIGSWKLTETSFSDGGSSGDWSHVPVEDQFLIHFNKDLTYLSQNDMISCNSGSFSTDEGILFLYPAGGQCNDSKFGYSISDSMVLTLIVQDNNCIEFCGYRLIKIEER